MIAQQWLIPSSLLIALISITPTISYAEQAPVVSFNSAPVGNYQAILQETLVTRRVGAANVGGRLTRVGEAGDQPIAITVTGYASNSELTSLANTEALAPAISAFSYGSVTLGNRTYPVNLAVSYPRGSHYVIHLISAQPFTVTGTTRDGTGTGVGYIRLSVPTDGVTLGTGELYSSTQIQISNDGNVVAQGGRTTATKLANVQLN